MLIAIAEVEALTLKLLMTKYDRDSSRMMADAMIFADAAGRHGHGIVRLLPAKTGSGGPLQQSASATPVVEQVSEISSVVDARGNPGILAAAWGMREAIRIASERRIAVVTTRGSKGTSGCLSFYLEQAARADLVAIAMANTFPMVAPAHGVERRFGTDPLGFAYPADPRPIILDMSTAATTYGDLLDASARGEAISVAVAIDPEGRPTTDADVVLKNGAILPFAGSHKSTGLATFCELFAGVLSGGTFCGVRREDGLGHFFVLMSPDLFGNRERWKSDGAKLADVIVGSRSADGTAVRVPGARTLTARDEAFARGTIDVKAEVWEALVHLANA